MTVLKVIAIGDSSRVETPEALLSRMEVKNGNLLHAIETAEGYLLARADPAIGEQLQAS